MLRRAAAIGLALHAFAHLVGFVSSWRLAALEGAPYSTLILNGTIDVGDAGIRAVGVAWLVVALAFAVAAAAVWRLGTGAVRLVALAAAISAAVCVVGLPAAALGLAADVAILAGAIVLVVGRPGLRPSVR